jgi:hypothetical protein
MKKEHKKIRIRKDESEKKIRKINLVCNINAVLLLLKKPSLHKNLLTRNYVGLEGMKCGIV